MGDRFSELKLETAIGIEMKSKTTEVQSILFDREKWTVAQAKQWLESHSYKGVTPDTTKNYHRFRQSPAFDFQKGSFRTMALGHVNRGIKAVIARPKKSTKNPEKTSKKPWLPSMLIDLAVPISIDLEGGEVLKFPIRGSYAMCSNKSGTEIWIMSKKNSKNVRATDDQGEKLYEKFTGFEHSEVGKMVNVYPKKMTRIGRAMSIVYRSDKFSKPGNTSDYIHAFSKYPTVSVDNTKQPTVVVIRGGKIRIKQEGITG